MRTYRPSLRGHSYKRSRVKRANWFKKGHVPYFRRKTSENLQDQASESTTFRRLNYDEARDVIHLCKDENTIPYKLRPQPEKKNITINNEVDENTIVNVKQLQLLLQSIH
jgi:hypothetical protein